MKTAKYVSQHSIARSGVEGEKTVMDWEKKGKKSSWKQQGILGNTLLLDQGWRVRKQFGTERRRVKKLLKTARYVSQHSIARSGVEGNENSYGLREEG